MQLNPCTDVIYATIDQSGKVILNGTCKRNTVPTKKFSVNFVTKSLKMNGVLPSMAASKTNFHTLETMPRCANSAAPAAGPVTLGAKSTEWIQKTTQMEKRF